MNGNRYHPTSLISAEQLAEWRAAFARIEREIKDEEQSLTDKKLVRDRLGTMIENAPAFVAADTGKSDVWVSTEPSVQAKLAKEPPPDDEGEHKILDGTLDWLVHRYRKDPRSPYQQVKHQTRGNYNSLLRRIRMDYGSQRLADWKVQNIQSIYDQWAEGGKIAHAHSHVTILRALVNFGATILQDGQCERLQVVLHNMNFPTAKKRDERMTGDQARAIIGKAHEKGYHSIALAQAFQFDCLLKQKDVIGEWVPEAEPGDSDVTDNNEKWLRGIRWSEVDKDLVLRHVAPWGGKRMQPQLTLAPLVMAEFKWMGFATNLPKSGPIILYEKTGLPYRPYQFRRVWREVADACGIPENVRNNDAMRAEKISFDSGSVQTNENRDDNRPGPVVSRQV